MVQSLGQPPGPTSARASRPATTGSAWRAVARESGRALARRAWNTLTGVTARLSRYRGAGSRSAASAPGVGPKHLSHPAHASQRASSLPDLGYDAHTRGWARRLLEHGDAAPPFPRGDAVESEADAARLRGVFPYLCRLHRRLPPEVLESRLAWLLTRLEDPGFSPRHARWDTTNVALRILGVSEGVGHLRRAGLNDAVGRLLPERWLERHRSLLAMGDWIEPAGNHRMVNALARVAIDGLQPVRGAHDRRAMDALEAEAAAQFLPDGGHVERCPYYHLQVLAAMRLVGYGRSVRPTLPRLAEAYASGRRALRHMTYHAHPAPFGDISRLWSGRTAEAEMRRVLGANGRVPARSLLEDTGIATLRWETLSGRTAELVADVGPLGMPENPGHAHDDFLTYCLRVGPIELVSDPGCYRYACDVESTWFKLAGAHNVVRHDDELRAPRGFYRWPRGVRLGSTVQVTRKAHHRIEARLLRPAGSGIVQQTRRWTIAPTALTVRDQVVMGRPGCGVARLNLGPGCRATREADGFTIRIDDGIEVARIRVRSTPKATASIVGGRIASSYGEVTTTEALEWRFPASAVRWALEVRLDFDRL